jgi:hypothetical protein
MHRLGALVLVGMVALWAAASRAADPPRWPERSPQPAVRPSPGATVREPVLEDEPEPGERGEDAEPGDDDDLDEGRALPSEPTLRPPPRPVPRGEEEEPPPPGETPPGRFGPAEPASAAQPLSPR